MAYKIVGVIGASSREHDLEQIDQTQIARAQVVPVLFALEKIVTLVITLVVLMILLITRRRRRRGFRLEFSLQRFAKRQKPELRTLVVKVKILLIKLEIFPFVVAVAHQNAGAVRSICRHRRPHPWTTTTLAHRRDRFGGLARL